MKKTRFQKPYKGRSATFSHKRFGKKSGVYLIKNPAGNIVYVGHSKSDVYTTMYRHFQSWNDRTQKRVTYSRKGQFTVRVVLCTAKQAVKLESALIMKHKPRNNAMKLDLLTNSEKTSINRHYAGADIIPASVDIGF